MTPRPYQQEAVDSTVRAIERGTRGIAMQLATGAGKTLVLAEIARHLVPCGKLLFLAHRQELINQLAATVQGALDCRVGVERAEQHASWNEQVVVGSVPTLGCNAGARLRGIDPTEFAAIFVDECHHMGSGCRTYMEILRWAGIADGYEHTGRGPVLIGCTATLRRHDKQTLAPWMQEVVADVPLRWLIDEGYLVPMKAVQLRSSTSLDQVRMRMGEFVQSDLERTLNTERRNALAVQHYRDQASGRPFLAFTSGVKHAHSLAAAFRQEGFRVEALEGNTPSDVRAETLERFRRGELHGLTSCAVLSEGTDLPMVQALYMMRPTESALVYSQQVGRGSRRWEPDSRWRGAALGLRASKQDCLVVDLTDNTSKHQLMHAPSLIGKPYVDAPKSSKPPRIPPARAATFEPTPISAHEEAQDLHWVDPWSEGVQDTDDFSWQRNGKSWSLRLPNVWATIEPRGSQWAATFEAKTKIVKLLDTELEAFQFIDTLALQRYGLTTKLPRSITQDPQYALTPDQQAWENTAAVRQLAQDLLDCYPKRPWGQNVLALLDALMPDEIAAIRASRQQERVRNAGSHRRAA